MPSKDKRANKQKLPLKLSILTRNCLLNFLKILKRTKNPKNKTARKKSNLITLLPLKMSFLKMTNKNSTKKMTSDPKLWKTKKRVKKKKNKMMNLDGEDAGNPDAEDSSMPEKSFIT